MTTVPPVFYFASTNLDLRQTDKPEGFPRDVFVEHVCFRKVDPAYFAWLRRRMESAKQRFETGRMSTATWEKMRGSFNLLQEWAVDAYGLECLQVAIRDFDSSAYTPPANRPPEPFLFPRTGYWKFSESVSADAVRKVNAIRRSAMAKGWSDERLYQNRGRFRFPLGQDYGLVCFLGPNDEVGDVAATRIEILHDSAGRKKSLRFANADVFPPRAAGVRPTDEFDQVVKKSALEPDSFRSGSVSNS